MTDILKKHFQMLEVISRGGKIFFISDIKKDFSTNIRFRLRVEYLDNLLSQYY